MLLFLTESFDLLVVLQFKNIHIPDDLYVASIHFPMRTTDILSHENKNPEKLWLVLSHAFVYSGVLIFIPYLRIPTFFEKKTNWLRCLKYLSYREGYDCFRIDWKNLTKLGIWGEHCVLTEAVAIAKLPAIQIRGIFYLFTVIKICYDRIKVSLELNVIYYNLYYFHNSPDESRSAPVRQQLCWCTRTRHTILYHWLQLGVISRIYHSPHTIDCNRFRNNLKVPN